MKSRTRSRSSATSGLGLKSIGSSPRLSGARNAIGWAASGPPVAGEELPVLLEQPGEVEVDHPGQRPLEDPRRLAAAQLRRDRQEELVDQAVGLELLVQVRAALGEQRPHAVLATEQAKRLGQVDRALVALQLQRRRGLGRVGLGGGEDQDPTLAGG